TLRRRLLRRLPGPRPRHPPAAGRDGEGGMSAWSALARASRPRRLLLATLVAAGLGSWWLGGRASGTGASAASAGGWVEVQRDDLVLGVEVTGTLAAVDSAFVVPPQIPEMWNQKIAFLAPEGSTVRQGTPVLGLDSSELEKKL